MNSQLACRAPMTRVKYMALASIVCTGLSLPALSAAAIPVLNTDMLKYGERQLTASAVHTSRGGDLSLKQGVNQFSGTTRTNAVRYNLSLTNGMNDALNFTTTLGYANTVEKHDLSGTTGTRMTENQDAGLSDVNFNIAFRLVGNDVYTLVQNIALTVPTASDAHGTPAVESNGILVTGRQSGHIGGGAAQAAARLDMSSKRESRAVVEGFVAWYTNDDSATPGSYAAGVDVALLFTPSFRTRLGYDFAHRSSNGYGGSSVSALYSRTESLGVEYQPSPKVTMKLRVERSNFGSQYSSSPGTASVVTDDHGTFLTLGVQRLFN